MTQNKTNPNCWLVSKIDDDYHGSTETYPIVFFSEEEAKKFAEEMQEEIFGIDEEEETPVWTKQGNGTWQTFGDDIWYHKVELAETR